MGLYLIGDFDQTTGEAILQLPPKDKIELSPDVSRVITKIKQEIDVVIEERELDIILEFLKKNYTLKDKKIPEKILSLFSHGSFLKAVQDYMSRFIPHILNNNSNHSFEDISFFVYLLGKGQIENTLKDLNTYDFDKIEQIFDMYIDQILTVSSQKENFDFSFQSYTHLFELFNKLSILNEVDTWRKKLIPDVVNILNQKIDLLEKKLAQHDVLDEDKKNILLHLRAKLLINFSHIGYISTQGRTLDDVLGDFLEIVKNQSNGYLYASTSHFGNKPHLKANTYQTFIGNMAYAINIMCQKLTSFDVGEIGNHPLFQQIQTKFLSHLDVDSTSVKNLDDLFIISNNVFASIYFDDQKVVGDLSGNTGKHALKSFISKKSDKTDFEFESLHHLVMFLPNLSLDDYLEVGDYLVNTPKYNNYNFEFFKLKTLDTIISKITEVKNNENVIILLTIIVIYIEKHKVASQLLNTYSRLYLSIAYYYSNCFDERYNERALEFFTLFFKMGGDESDFEKYGKKIEDFYYNIGIFELSVSVCGGICPPNTLCSTDNPACIFDYEQCVKFGEQTVKKYRKSYDTIVKNDLDRILSDLLENALNQNGIEDSEINRKISVVLSNKVFHGIAETYIVDVNVDANFIDNIAIQNGIESFQIDLFNGYKLCFVYPKIYREIFSRVYEKENYYMVRNIENIITSYLKRKDFYTDPKTGLPNELKLKTILSTNTKKISFIAIKLNTLKSINNGYSYELGDQYIKNIAQSLLKIDGLQGSVYRLSGAKIGIILNMGQDNIPAIVEKIKEIKFKIGSSVHKLDAHIGVVENEVERLVEKSHVAISHAKTAVNGVAFYTEQFDNTQRDKELVDYIGKLDKALEEDRVIPYYQPLVDAKSLLPYKYEALMRVSLLTGGVDNPVKYLRSAETFGRLVPITLVMIQKVFQYATTNDGKFSINLAGEDLSNKDLLIYIKQLLEETQVDPERITFEILEGQWNADNSNIKTVRALKNMGFKIAMDDFGSSNSNINRLLDFLSTGLLDFLKFDAEIIKTLEGTNVNLTKEIQEIRTQIMNLEGVDITQFHLTKGKTYKEREGYLQYYMTSEKVNKIIENYPELKNLLELIKEKSKNMSENKEYIDELFDQVFKKVRIQAEKMANVTKSLLRGLVQTCHNVGVKTVAEYVANPTILKACQDLGIDYLQGFHVGMPNATMEIVLPEKK